MRLNPRRVDDTKKTIVVSNDTWNCVDGELTHQYHDATSGTVVRDVGYINFRLDTGQIGVFFIEEEYRSVGFGKQMLLAAINAHGKADTHPFWSNVWNKAFQLKDPVHISVTGEGFVMPTFANLVLYAKLTNC